MNTQILFEQSELALASYANLNGSVLSAQKVNLKDAGLSDVQADTFASRYAVLTYHADDGDTIGDSDADGKGVIYLNGKQLNFATRKKGETTWKDAAGNTYALTNGKLEINDPLTIENFDNGELGIYLDDEEDSTDPNGSPRPPGYNPGNASLIPRRDPLVLDLDGNGQIDAVASTASSVYFDFNGDGILDGGAGNDTLSGNTGDDTYAFGSGYGQDTVYDYGSTVGAGDTVRIGADVTPADVTVTRDQNHLYLSLNGGADRLALSNWFYAGYRIEAVRFADGTVWNASELEQRIKPLPGTSAADTLFGGAADNTLDGGLGNDSMDDSAQLFDTRESRRWRDGERSVRATNDSAWRRSA